MCLFLLSFLGVVFGSVFFCFFVVGCVALFLCLVCCFGLCCGVRFVGVVVASLVVVVDCCCYGLLYRSNENPRTINLVVFCWLVCVVVFGSR